MKRTRERLSRARPFRVLAVASAAAQRLVAQRWLGLLVPLQHEAFAGIKWDLLHESPAPVLPDLLYEEADSAPSVTSYSIMEDEVQVRARISQREHGPGPVRACARCRLVSLRCRAHRPRATGVGMHGTHHSRTVSDGRRLLSSGVWMPMALLGKQ